MGNRLIINSRYDTTVYVADISDGFEVEVTDLSALTDGCAQWDGLESSGRDILMNCIDDGAEKM